MTTTRARLARRTSGLTLRARLVGLVLLLLTTATLVVGTVTLVSLHRSLLGQVDDQLASAAGRSRMDAGRGGRGPQGDPDGDGPSDAPRFLDAPGTAVGTLGAVVSGEDVVGAVVGAGGDARAVPAQTEQALTRLPVGTTPRTVRLPSIGEYRVVAARMPDGRVVVTGLPLAQVGQTVGRLAVVVAGVGGIWLVVAGVGGGLIVRRTLRPLQQVAATAAEVARTPLARGQVSLDVRVPRSDPRTEVGQVSAAVNAMIGHVERSLAVREASEQRVRGFVADASHELRTPLAAIRGYAELTRRSGEDVPPGVAQALQRVESEATRMTGLVEDLLLLARLDAAQDVDGPPLDRAPVDLAPVVVDALTDAQVAGPDHHWRLELPDDPVVVLGDENRLHQVLANLLANARSHTPAGTTVTAAVTVRPGHAELQVLDDGPGISPEVLPTVFERFVRGESSRSRAHGSTGLGLAIVASLVQAHDGTVSVQSEPGRTVFSVRLPLAPGTLRPAALPAGEVLVAQEA